MNKKVHFYFPKKKIDVENQTFFGDYEHIQNDENIYDRLYQSTLNSLFDLEEPNDEIEKMIKFDYSSRISFYMTRLHDDRFEPLTPTNEIFSNASPKICLDIRNEGFTLWNCSNQAISSDQNFRTEQPQYLSLSFDNDAEVIYSIIESFVTGKINFNLLRIIDRLQIPYDSSGNILCEIADSRFDSNSTCLSDFDEEGISRKRINLEIGNNAIYYIFTLAKKALIRKKNVHLSSVNTENKSSNAESKIPIRSISSVSSLPNVANNSQSANPSIINSSSEPFIPIKKNDSTPNLMINPNLSHLSHNQMVDDGSNNSFNQFRSDSLPINFQNEQSKMINFPNQNFIPEPTQNSANDYMQMQSIDPGMQQINNSLPNHIFKENTFQIPIQTMSSKPIQSETPPQIQIQPQYNKHQQLPKQKQQHSQQQKQQQLQKSQQLQKQQLQQQPQFQPFPIPNQPQIPKPELSQSQPIIKQEETAPKSKSKSSSSLPQNTSSSLNNAPSSSQSPNTNAIYEAEGNLLLLLHPTFCSDPSPDVCRVSSILDFRKKMWNESPTDFVKNYEQMKSRPNLNVNHNFHISRQSYQINPPNEKIMIPETINQMFISKNLSFKFSNY